MRYVVQYRMAFNDVYVTQWEDIAESNQSLLDTPTSAYTWLCEYLELIPDRVGFTDAPDCGRINTDRTYDGYSLFQHPRDDRHQYRIVESQENVDCKSNDRVIALD